MELTKTDTSFPSSTSGFDQLLERYHWVLAEFFRGDTKPAKTLFSHRDDVTLANPFGPIARGWAEISATVDRAVLHYRDGKVTRFETVSKHVTAHLACVVEVEMYSTKVGAGEDMVPVALRVTSIFRPEDGTWKLVHRHADPITSARPPESVIERELRE